MGKRDFSTISQTMVLTVLLTDDGITQWHPAFLFLGQTLEECAAKYIAIKSLKVPQFYVFDFDSCPENPAILNPDTATTLPLAGIIVNYALE